ncbi:MAG: hypothetical protein L3J31_00505 [Bacteroidales bacterium]|nr:hypothetical protein [Bacteroidales bacterium]MCF6341270.1 hypothetical protein [Bacteroidales bacterium]
MNTFVLTGTIIVFFALTFYTLGIVKEQKGKTVSKYVLLFLSLGLVFDISATVFMIAGSSVSGISLHGVIGYSSLLGMLIDNFLLWRLRFQKGLNTAVPNGVHLYSRYAYTWWVIAFVTGGLLVYLNR